MYIRVIGKNEDGATIRDTGVVESSGTPGWGDVFRFARESFGRCVGSVTIAASDPAVKDGEHEIGWFFRKRVGGEEITSRVTVHADGRDDGAYHYRTRRGGAVLGG